MLLHSQKKPKLHAGESFTLPRQVMEADFSADLQVTSVG